MKRKTLLKSILVCLLILLFLSPVYVSAQQRQGRFGRGGLYGDWNIKMKFGQREFESILYFTRNREQQGQYVGYWISFWGMNELSDVKFEENKLSFTQTMRFGENERTSKFTGTIEDNKLTGVLAGDDRETEITGTRAPRMSRGTGIWDMKITAGEREYKGTLTITVDKEGQLTGKWKSSRGESDISDIKYENRMLSFKRVIRTDNGEWQSAFEGTIGRDSLEGVFKSDRGEANCVGTRVGTEAIGTWNLELTSDRGSRKQRLRINPDMSALYGSMVIKQVELKDNKLTFGYVMEFGDQKFETDFEGEIAEDKLTGELKTSRGSQKVTGIRRTFRRPGTSRNEN